MIIAERKPFDDIYNKVEKYNSILILGCGTCVTVCMAGGEKEASILANQLILAARQDKKSISAECITITRQCDREFFDDATVKALNNADAVISMGCGVGVQFIAETFPDVNLFSSLNTKFYGATLEQGVWSERCAGCGDCIIDNFGSVCPVARCSKSLLNGPCGGSADGKCEISSDTDCAWQLIYDRMELLGRVNELENNQPIRDWSNSKDGGPGKIVRDDMTLENNENG
jgi:ferredoxin